MIKKLFGKKNETLNTHVKSPATGTFVDLSEVPDPTFSEKLMGEGFAIEPADGKVVSPVEGTVVQVFPTKHAVGIKSAEGLDVLIHIGLETASLNGEGFTVHVKEGSHVSAGEPMIEFDLDLIREKAKSTITPVVFTEENQIEHLEKQSLTEAIAGETDVATVTVKS